MAAVATGTNADDAVAGFRPGIRAAAERGAVTPLLDAGLTKAQVRAASRALGLVTWDKPAAACLSSRVAYGVPVTRRAAGPGGAGRGRRTSACWPTPACRCATCGCATWATGPGSRWTRRWSSRWPALAPLAAAVLAAGFTAVEVDPRGFRSGSMNEVLAAGPDGRR